MLSIIRSSEGSPVWYWFPESNDLKFICKLCNEEISCCGAGSTTGLRSHLINHHKILKTNLLSAAEWIANNYRLRKTPSLPSSGDLRQIFSKGYQCLLMHSEWLLQLLVLENIPFNFVNSQFVHEFFQAIANQKVPDRTTLARHLPTLHANIKAKVTQILRGARFASIQYDLWTSKVTSKSFGAIVATILSPTKELQHILLGLLSLKKSHTASNIKEWAIEVLSSFGIALNGTTLQSPVISISTIDMGANVCKSVKDLGLLYLPCSAHQLNLVLQHAITSVDSVKKHLADLAAVTKLLKKSPKITERFSELVHESAGDIRLISAVGNWTADHTSLAIGT